MNFNILPLLLSTLNKVFHLKTICDLTTELNNRRKFLIENLKKSNDYHHSNH